MFECIAIKECDRLGGFIIVTIQKDLTNSGFIIVTIQKDLTNLG